MASGIGETLACWSRPHRVQSRNFTEASPELSPITQTEPISTYNRQKMGNKARKRGRESGQGDNEDNAPVKRRRQINEEQLKLSKFYEDLAAESDDVRFEAAKQLIAKFSPESKPAAKDVESVLSRLIKGLCSQRKAARVGFSLTLTELLRQIFGQKETLIEDLSLDVASLIKLVEEKTKVEGNVPGRVSHFQWSLHDIHDLLGLGAA
jgi:hypothetical protein